MQNPDARPHAINRLVFLAILALLWAVVIFCRLVHLQVVSYSTYAEMARRQQQRRVKLLAPRGTIFDRNHKPLAISVPVDSVCLNPLRVPDRPLAAELLARVLSGVDARKLLERMDAAVARAERARAAGLKQPPGVGFLWVKRKISPEESDRLRSLKLEGVEFRQESQRFYPDGILASHVLGSVDFAETGNAGLEMKLNSELRGEEGSARVTADVAKRVVASDIHKPPVPGKHIVTTLDERIQFVAERALRAGFEEYNARSGSVVVLNPHTGEILAMASYPTFDPNVPPPKGEPKEFRFNQPFSVAFEPGSVFKIITVSSALETTGLRPSSPINCGGGAITLFGRTVHEAKHGYGTLTVSEVLEKSSNVGAIQIARVVGKENLYRYVRLFGFGDATGVPLPSESCGYIRKPEVWHPWALMSVAMGHEVSTSTLQLAQAAGAIANGGLLVRPRLILSRQRPGGPVEKEPAPPPKRILKPETAIMMRQMMEGVVLRGTGKAARLVGYTAGGKTGSAQIFDLATRKYTHEYNGSFVGFAPVTNPAIVIAVTLNGVKKYGGVVAAPIFKEIATETLRLLGVPKDIPDELPPPPDPEELNDLAIAEGSQPPEDLPALGPRMRVAPPPPATPVSVAAAPAGRIAEVAAATPTVVAHGPMVPSFQGKTLRAVLEEAIAAGVQLDIQGTGIARAQTPPAGSYLGPRERVRVEFR